MVIAGVQLVRPVLLTMIKYGTVCTQMKYVLSSAADTFTLDKPQEDELHFSAFLFSICIINLKSK
jgi:hypothetical protein